MKALKGINQLTDDVAAVKAALEDTQDLAETETLLYAEAGLGRRLQAIPEKKASSGGGTRSLPAGITKKQSHYAQELSRNKGAIAEIVATARGKGEVPVRQQVLKSISAAKLKTNRANLAKKVSVIPKQERWNVSPGNIYTYKTKEHYD